MKHTKLYAVLLSLVVVLAIAAGAVYGFRDTLFGRGPDDPTVNDPVVTDKDTGTLVKDTGTSDKDAGTTEKDTSSSGNGVTVTELSQTIKKKYKDSELVDYKKPQYDLPKDQVFVLDVNFDPTQAGFQSDEINKIVNVFLDAELTYTVEANVSYDSEKGRISVAPPNYPVFEPNGYYDFADFKPASFLEKSADWGYASRYFIAEFYSADGKLLNKPAVTIFTIRRELDSPKNVEFYKDDGCMALRWDPVDGADGYLIYKLSPNSITGNTIHKGEIGEVTETQYVYQYVWQMTFYTEMNMTFYYDDLSLAEFELSVVAVGGESASVASTTVYSRDILSVLPHTIDFFAYEDEEDVNYFSRDIGDLGLYRVVEMCDHSMVKMPVTYLIDEAEVTNMHDVYPESFEDDYYVLLIPYEVKGTSLRSSSALLDYDYPGLRDDLLALKAREEEVASKGGRIDRKIKKNMEDTDGEENDPVTLSVEEFKVFATSALSEYIAVNLINGAQKISLEDFPESYDAEYLISAFQEAMYQNPYVLGIDDAGIDMDDNLVVWYEDSQAERERKQAEIRSEVARVVAQIIKPGMSDLEKELAINDYLCENAEYDFEALESAAENDFKYVDPIYNDSFTAYGVLVKKVGVCASYAAAFKLLADEAGLECIVVTGYLYGDLAHAWNRVLTNGEWMSVDATNNGNESLRNPIFNLPDRAASSVLVENNSYIMESSKAAYIGENEDIEFYHIEGKFFSQSQIVDMLLDGLRREGSVTLRTDYELTDKQFNKIVQAVLSKGNYENAGAVMWLGTIHMELEN
ncbi:MAG: hypothetical protein LBH28_07400 [Oscillospiraceae bacterium]|jgi:hypothetical protein|nr:hypothetical protein [Oscillospiraceae bacterium]